MLDKSLMV